jgi:hypothetical protein
MAERGTAVLRTYQNNRETWSPCDTPNNISSLLSWAHL